MKVFIADAAGWLTWKAEVREGVLGRGRSRAWYSPNKGLSWSHGKFWNGDNSLLLPIWGKEAAPLYSTSLDASCPQGGGVQRYLWLNKQFLSQEQPILPAADGVCISILKGNLGDKPHCPLQVPTPGWWGQVREDFSEEMILEWF